MEPLRLKRNQGQLMLTLEELLIINNALNDVCHGLDLFEFQTRTGADREEVEKPLDAVLYLIDKMDELEDRGGAGSS